MKLENFFEFGHDTMAPLSAGLRDGGVMRAADILDALRAVKAAAETARARMDERQWDWSLGREEILGHTLPWGSLLGKPHGIVALLGVGAPAREAQGARVRPVYYPGQVCSANQESG